MGCLGCTKAKEDAKEVVCVIFNGATLTNFRGFKYVDVGAVLVSVIPDRIHQREQEKRSGAVKRLAMEQ